jgi:hypothetical protein
MTTYFNGTTGVTSDSFESTTTDFITLPSGTTAQRPTGVIGMIRFNTTISSTEVYNGTTWVSE